MYEAPRLVEIGKAEESILGLVTYGDDVDGNLVIGPLEFAEDESPLHRDGRR